MIISTWQYRVVKAIIQQKIYKINSGFKVIQYTYKHSSLLFSKLFTSIEKMPSHKEAVSALGASLKLNENQWRVLQVLNSIDFQQTKQNSFDQYKAGLESNKGARHQQSHLMQQLVTPTTPQSKTKQKSTNEQSSWLITWAKNMPSRFGLKLYTFTPKKNHSQKCVLPIQPTPTQTISTQDKSVVTNQFVVAATPIKLVETKQEISKTNYEKEDSISSEYSPNQKPSTKKKKKPIRKSKKKIEEKQLASPIILSF